MKSIFSVERRKELYENILAEYLSAKRIYYSLCFSLPEHMTFDEHKLFKERKSDLLGIYLFPELLKYKPKDKAIDSFWWPVTQRKKRIMALRKAIKDCESQINQKV